MIDPSVSGVYSSLLVSTFIGRGGFRRQIDIAPRARCRDALRLPQRAGHSSMLILSCTKLARSYYKCHRKAVRGAFRMSKRDLQARPIYHHKRESIEAHLTV